MIIQDMCCSIDFVNLALIVVVIQIFCMSDYLSTKTKVLIRLDVDAVHKDDSRPLTTSPPSNHLAKQSISLHRAETLTNW